MNYYSLCASRFASEHGVHVVHITIHLGTGNKDVQTVTFQKKKCKLWFDLTYPAKETMDEKKEREKSSLFFNSAADADKCNLRLACI